MRLYTQQHRHYCGIDLHARSLYICILDRSGKTLVHQKLACDRDELLRVLKPYRPPEFSCKAAGLEPCRRRGTVRGLVSCNDSLDRSALRPRVG